MIESINLILSDMDVIRIISILTMYGVFGYMDLKTREINDKWFLFFGIIAIVLLIVDYIFYDGYSILEWLILIASLIVVYILWKISLYPTGDFFAFIITIVFMPTLYDIISPVFVIMILSIVTIAISHIPYNIILNLSEYRKGKLFKGVKGTKLNKAVVFIKGHRHRAYEHHVGLMENPNKTLRYSYSKYQYVKSGTINKYVEYAAPLLTFAGIAAGIFLIPILYFFRA